MWSVRVVVHRVGVNDALEVAAAADQQPVKALAPQACDPALGVRPRPRCPHGRLDHTDAFGAEDLIEVARELAVTIADQKARPQPFVVESHQQVARLLGDPGSVRIGADPRKVDAAACKLNEKPDVEPFEEHGVDGEEVALEDARRLPAQKLRPAGFESARRRLDPLASQDLPGGCWQGERRRARGVRLGSAGTRSPGSRTPATPPAHARRPASRDGRGDDADTSSGAPQGATEFPDVMREGLPETAYVT